MKRFSPLNLTSVDIEMLSTSAQYLGRAANRREIRLSVEPDEVAFGFG